VSSTGVIIEAPEPAGVFYGIQTLRQLLPLEIERRQPLPRAAWEIPGVTIRDAPRFGWRGYMMDEGRHFHGKETMLRTLDLMALQKLNVLHWHLTEDQGWRLEITRYPRLTEVGSHRKGTSQRYLGGEHDSIPHSGFYTQEEVREVVAYAAQHHITIVPEIEMPGHSLAALAAYPELSCTGGPFDVACRFGVIDDILCGGKEEVFTFLENVLDEVMELFPSPFIHIGGDEAPKKRWQRCPDCQRSIDDQGLKDEAALQVALTNRIAAYLAAHGRRAVGWNEILHEGLAERAVVQHWLRNRRRVISGIRQGRDVIVSNYWSTYLDHSYTLTPLSKAYKFEPVYPELDEQDARHVLGVEAPMWTEWVPTRARLDYQTYPRLTAFAETGWTPREMKGWPDFRRRLDQFLPRLDELGVLYAPLAEAEPPWFKRMFGALSIARAQRRTAE
jgi:hexosaminidase